MNYINHATQDAKIEAVWKMTRFKMYTSTENTIKHFLSHNTSTRT